MFTRLSQPTPSCRGRFQSPESQRCFQDIGVRVLPTGVPHPPVSLRGYIECLYLPTFPLQCFDISVATPPGKLHSNHPFCHHRDLGQFSSPLEGSSQYWPGSWANQSYSPALPSNHNYAFLPSCYHNGTAVTFLYTVVSPNATAPPACFRAGSSVSSPYSCYWNSTSCVTGPPTQCSHYFQDSIGCLSGYLPLCYMNPSNHCQSSCDQLNGTVPGATACVGQSPSCHLDLTSSSSLGCSEGAPRNQSLSSCTTGFWDVQLLYCFQSLSQVLLLYPCSNWTSYQPCLDHSCQWSSSSCIPLSFTNTHTHPVQFLNPLLSGTVFSFDILYLPPSSPPYYPQALYLSPSLSPLTGTILPANGSSCFSSNGSYVAPLVSIDWFSDCSLSSGHVQPFLIGPPPLLLSSCRTTPLRSSYLIFRASLDLYHTTCSTVPPAPP